MIRNNATYEPLSEFFKKSHQRAIPLDARISPCLVERRRTDGELENAIRIIVDVVTKQRLNTKSSPVTLESCARKRILFHLAKANVQKVGELG